MMNRRPFICCFLALALAGVVASCAMPPAAATRVLVSDSARRAASPSSQLFEEANVYRRSKGLGEMQRHGGLDRLAQRHGEYLRQHRGSFSLSGKNVSHIGFDGRALAARENYQVFSISENVAAATHAGANPAPMIMGLWKNSRDHHSNMVDTWTHCGVGVVVDQDGMVFAVMLFATVSSSQMTMRNRFNKF